MNSKFKFENFKFPDFPVYTSVQNGKGNIVIPHFHNAVELNLILNGECTFYIDTEVLHCSKSDIIFIPAGCVHSVFSHNENTQIKGITFDLSVIDIKANKEPMTAYLNKDVVKDYSVSHNKSVLGQYIGEFSLNNQNNSIIYRLNVLSEIYKICGALIENYDVKNDDEVCTRIKPVIEYIKINFRQQIYVSDLSSLINVSDSHLIRLFKSVTNKSPIEYVTDLRIEEALKLLVKDELSITEISEKVGFSNVNFMIKVFKSKLDTTPNKYRKRLSSQG